MKLQDYKELAKFGASPDIQTDQRRFGDFMTRVLAEVSEVPTYSVLKRLSDQSICPSPERIIEAYGSIPKFRSALSGERKISDEELLADFADLRTRIRAEQKVPGSIIRITGEDIGAASQRGEMLSVGPYMSRFGGVTGTLARIIPDGLLRELHAGISEENPILTYSLIERMAEAGKLSSFGIAKADMLIEQYGSVPFCREAIEIVVLNKPPRGKKEGATPEAELLADLADLRDRFKNHLETRVGPLPSREEVDEEASKGRMYGSGPYQGDRFENFTDALRRIVDPIILNGVKEIAMEGNPFPNYQDLLKAHQEGKLPHPDEIIKSIGPIPQLRELAELSCVGKKEKKSKAELLSDLEGAILRHGEDITKADINDDASKGKCFTSEPYCTTLAKAGHFDGWTDAVKVARQSLLDKGIAIPASGPSKAHSSPSVATPRVIKEPAPREPRAARAPRGSVSRKNNRSDALITRILEKLEKDEVFNWTSLKRIAEELKVLPEDLMPRGYTVPMIRDAISERTGTNYNPEICFQKDMEALTALLGHLPSPGDLRRAGKEGKTFSYATLEERYGSAHALYRKGLGEPAHNEDSDKALTALCNRSFFITTPSFTLERISSDEKHPQRENNIRLAATFKDEAEFQAAFAARSETLLCQTLNELSEKLSGAPITYLALQSIPQGIPPETYMRVFGSVAAAREAAGIVGTEFLQAESYYADLAEACERFIETSDFKAAFSRGVRRGEYPDYPFLAHGMARQRAEIAFIHSVYQQTREAGGVRDSKLEITIERDSSSPVSPEVHNQAAKVWLNNLFWTLGHYPAPQEIDDAAAKDSAGYTTADLQKIYGCLLDSYRHIDGSPVVDDAAKEKAEADILQYYLLNRSEVFDDKLIRLTDSPEVIAFILAGNQIPDLENRAIQILIQSLQPLYFQHGIAMSYGIVHQQAMLGRCYPPGVYALHFGSLSQARIEAGCGSEHSEVMLREVDRADWLTGNPLGPRWTHRYNQTAEIGVIPHHDWPEKPQALTAERERCVKRGAVAKLILEAASQKFNLETIDAEMLGITEPYTRYRMNAALEGVADSIPDLRRKAAVIGGFEINRRLLLEADTKWLSNHLEREPTREELRKFYRNGYVESAEVVDPKTVVLEEAYEKLVIQFIYAGKLDEYTSRKILGNELYEHLLEIHDTAKDLENEIRVAAHERMLLELKQASIEMKLPPTYGNIEEWAANSRCPPPGLYIREFQNIPDARAFAGLVTTEDDSLRFLGADVDEAVSRFDIAHLERAYSEGVERGEYAPYDWDVDPLVKHPDIEVVRAHFDTISSRTNEIITRTAFIVEAGEDAERLHSYIERRFGNFHAARVSFGYYTSPDSMQLEADLASVYSGKPEEDAFSAYQEALSRGDVAPLPEDLSFELLMDSFLGNRLLTRLADYAKNGSEIITILTLERGYAEGILDSPEIYLERFGGIAGVRRVIGERLDTIQDRSVEMMADLQAHIDKNGGVPLTSIQMKELSEKGLVPSMVEIRAAQTSYFGALKHALTIDLGVNEGELQKARETCVATYIKDKTLPDEAAMVQNLDSQEKRALLAAALQYSSIPVFQREIREEAERRVEEQKRLELEKPYFESKEALGTFLLSVLNHLKKVPSLEDLRKEIGELNVPALLRDMTRYYGGMVEAFRETGFNASVTLDKKQRSEAFRKLCMSIIAQQKIDGAVWNGLSEQAMLRYGSQYPAVWAMAFSAGSMNALNNEIDLQMKHLLLRYLLLEADILRREPFDRDLQVSARQTRAAGQNITPTVALYEKYFPTEEKQFLGMDGIFLRNREELKKIADRYLEKFAHAWIARHSSKTLQIAHVTRLLVSEEGADDFKIEFCHGVRVVYGGQVPVLKRIKELVPQIQVESEPSQGNPNKSVGKKAKGEDEIPDDVLEEEELREPTEEELRTNQ